MEQASAAYSNWVVREWAHGCHVVQGVSSLCFLWGDTARSLDMGEPAGRSRAAEQPASLRLLS